MAVDQHHKGETKHHLFQISTETIVRYSTRSNIADSGETIVWVNAIGPGRISVAIVQCASVMKHRKMAVNMQNRVEGDLIYSW